MTFKGQFYPDVAKHQSLLIEYDSPFFTLENIRVGASFFLSTASVDEGLLFNNLCPDWKPKAT